jgi:hypothetical protein
MMPTALGAALRVILGIRMVQEVTAPASIPAPGCETPAP